MVVWWRCVTVLTNFQGKGNILKTPNEAESSSAKVSEPCSSVSDSSAKAKRPLTLQVLFCDNNCFVENKFLLVFNLVAFILGNFQ